MVFPLTALIIVGLAAHTVFATPLPPQDCALDTPSSCTVLSSHPHGDTPRNAVPPSNVAPCPLEEACSVPTAIDPTPTSTAPLTYATTCTTNHGPIPIGTECFQSGPHAGQCITFECLSFPTTCGCPGAPPPPKPAGGQQQQQQNRNASPSPNARASPTSTPVSITSGSVVSTRSPPEPCAPWTGPFPLGEECLTIGPYAMQCTSLYCLERPNTCGCPEAPSKKEKRTIIVDEPRSSPAACTEWTGPFPIGEQCFTDGPYAGQCISFYCLERPDTCGCPDAAPPAASTPEET